MTNTNEIKRSLTKFLNNNRSAEVPAWMGDLSGTVQADAERFNVYVVLMSGEVVTVRNNRVPNIARLPVIIGYDGTDTLQVLRSRDVYDKGTPYPELPSHADASHTWPGYDTAWIRAEQFMPGLALPSSGFVIQFMGFAYYMTGWHLIENQEIDLSSEAAVTGANFILVEIDSAGVITFNTGATVASRELLEYSDIPSPSATKRPLFAVKMYIGQTEIIQTAAQADIVDLRWSGFASGSSTTMSVQYVDTKANIEALTGLSEGAIAYATDTNELGSYSGAAWTWGGGGGGGHVIQDEGTPLTARANLNFVGAGVTATDDAGNNATVVTIPAGGITGSGTNGNITKWTGAGTVGDATNTDAEVASAVSLKHTQGTDTALGALSTKNPPIDADKVIYRDSVSTDALVTSTWTQVKAFLKTYFDTIYAAISHGSHIPVAGITTQILQWASEATAKWVTVSGDASIADGGALAVNKTRLNVRNETGSTIVSTRAVYISGFNNFPLISLVDNTDETKHNLIGVTIAPIANSADGYIATTGQFDAETNSWNVGTELYMSTSGNLTSTEPTAGTVRHVGIVTVKANYPTGKILMYTQPEEYYTAMTAGKDYIIRMGDSAGANKVSFKDYANVEQASLNSDGALLAVSVNGINQTDGTELASFANGGTGTHTASDAHIASTANPHSVTAAQAAAIPNDGWIAITATGTSGTLDAPSFEISKYFIVTKVGAYSGGATVITCYGGTDYTLVATATTAITNPFYSTVKAPFGFPLTQSKWTVEVTDSTTRSQATPTGGTWYNINNTSISVPIGVWNHITSVLATTDKAAAGNLDVYCTLSTANNSASDASSTRKIAVRATSVYLESSLILASTISVTSKTTYYLNTKTDANTVANIYNNNTAQNLSIKLICVYL
jgi:hypothetical protein